MTPARFWSDEPAYAWQQFGPIRVQSFILAIVLSAGVDLGTFITAQFAGFTVVGAHLISFACAAVLALLLPPKSVVTAEPGRVLSPGVSLIIALLVLFLRGGVLALLVQKAGFSPLAAMVPVAVFSALLLHSGKALQLSGTRTRYADHQRWHTLAVSLVLYSIGLRLVYIGVPNLIPEEAYYWNYAQHLDWGYLDHPPMVAWIIKLGTLGFGNTEFGVRIGAAVCGLVAAGFAYALARELFGRRTAVGVMLLVSALPFYFGAGCLMTPDAPLTACWSGALYFLYRAILRERPGAWIGAGVCIGLGMLSKYTIGLLVPATLLCLLIDSRSRRWLARPQPYLAGLIAAALFLPVIYWNATHGWVSFVFQTARRINEPSVFSLHTLLGECMVLLTPTVFAGALVILAARGRLAHRLFRIMDAGRRRFLLLAVTLIPLAVVTVFSLTHEPKLNWTGPAWLAALPFAAWVMLPSQTSGGAFTEIVRKLWRPTLVAMLLLFGAVFHYLALGFPGIAYPKSTWDIAGWKELQTQVSAIEASVRANTTQPLIAGFDRYNISSELAFYGAPDGPRHAAGQHLFGEPALMYEFWFPAAEQQGKTIVIVSRHRDWLDGEKVVPRFDSLSAITTLPVSLNGKEIGKYYARVGFGYRANP